METTAKSGTGRGCIHLQSSRRSTRDRIIQALADNPTERELHSWIQQLLHALDAASKATEATSETYKMELRGGGSIVNEAQKIPFERGRNDFLVNCWIETLCTAEARVLGWLYKEFYGRPFQPSDG